MADVTIFTRQMCGYCAAAKKLLATKEVTVTEHDATFDPELRKQMISQSGGASTFPQIFVGNTHVGGCDDLFAMEKAGNLDALLNS